MCAAAIPGTALADPGAATLADRLMQTVYPNRAIPAGYGMPVTTEPAGTNPRHVLSTFTRTADGTVTHLRFDLYDDAASLGKKYPPATSDADLNPVVYRFGSYHATCSARYSKAKAQVADVCGMALGSSVMIVETVFAVPAGTVIDTSQPSGPFLDSIRKTSTAFVTGGAAYYQAVSGLPS